MRDMAGGAVPGTLVLGLVLMCCVFPNAVPARWRRSPKCWSTLSAHRAVLEPERPCLEIHCRCHDTTADCSSVNLTYVPRVPGNVSFLNLSNNYIREIAHPAFFVNASKVTEVDLYNNGLTRIVSNAFRSMGKLERVLLGGNRLTYDQLAPVLYVPRLKSLELKCGGLANIPREFFSNRSCSQLRYIDMSWNGIQDLDMEVFQPLRQLESLLVRYNQIRNVQPAYHPSLKKWIMHKNALSKFPVTCDREGKTLYPVLTILDLNFNSISEISESVCFPSLTVLSLSFNMFDIFYKNMFSLQWFPVLNNLSLTQMRVKITEIQEFTFNNSNLIDISMAQNNIDFSSATVSKDMFQGCGQLQRLFLDSVNIADVDPEYFQRLMAPLANSVEVLYLGKNKLQWVGDTFKNWTRLRKLYLYDNRLRSLPDGAFDHMENLTVLKVGSNQLTTVSPFAFCDETRNRLEKIDLSGNPFTCDCDILYLKQWVLSEPDKFLDYRQRGYRCYELENTDGGHIKDFYLPEQACLLHPSTSILISSSVIIFITLLLIFMAIWHWWWHLHLFLYEFPRRDVQRAAQRGHFRFHVLVVYDEDDIRWVRFTLLPVLEDWGLKVCLHDRDFHPGRSHLDNIAECLPASHSVVLVFSSSFASNTLRQFELSLCHDQAHQEPHEHQTPRRPPIPILLRDDKTRLTNSMLAVLKSDGFRLIWPRDREEQDAGAASRYFWKSLYKALDEAIKNAKEDRRKKRD
ncbi:toll-like receptor 2 [Babylonia areolata]|uniref:toll-like receptor 2 n=1 Tax=Babylonia areolata TaxID=304850 RepID=UPI003FCF2427